MKSDRKWWYRLWCATAFIALLGSFVWYQSFLASGVPSWQVHHFDHADYRFIAEHFWGISHDYTSYAPEFASGWGAYLSVVPFRGIGVGTFYLFYTYIFDLGGSSMPFFLQMCFYALYLFAFWAVWKHWNLFVAFLCLVVFLHPKYWALTNELLSEPFLRIIFLCIWLCLIQLQERKDATSRYIVLFVLTCMASQIKSQWMLLSGIFFFCCIVEAMRFRSIKLGAISFVFLVVPALLVLVNGIGWSVWAPTAGEGLHTNFKTAGQYLHSYCDDFPTSTICDVHANKNSWWQMPIPEFTTRNEWHHFDTQSKGYLLHNMKRVISDLAEGLYMSTNFPAGISGNTPFSRSPLCTLIDVFTIFILLCGLFVPKMRCISLFALSLFFIPAIANIFAAYVARYARAMAGIPLATSILILTSYARSLLELVLALRQRS